MNNKKSAFSLIELSIVLIIASFLIAIIINTGGILDAARINSARNITKSSIVIDTKGIVLWLDATSKEAFNNNVIQDGDSIDQWNDSKQSHITSYDAIQATSSLQPSYKKNAIKKLPGIYFDGSDSLQISSFPINSYITLFIVGQFTNSSLFIEHSSNASSNDGFFFDGQGNRPTTIRRSTLTSQNSTNTNWFGNKAAIATMRYSGGNNISYQLNNNGFITTTDTTNAVTNNIIIDNLNIGSRNGSSLFSTGSFGEIIIYNRALNDEEVTNIIAYLKNKWKIS